MDFENEEHYNEVMNDMAEQEMQQQQEYEQGQQGQGWQ